jgi:hypothetical protein
VAATTDSVSRAVQPPGSGEDSENDTKTAYRERRPNQSQKPKTENVIGKFLDADLKNIYDALRKKAATVFGPGANRTI